MPDVELARRILEVVPRTMRVIRAQMRSQAGELTVPQFRAIARLNRYSHTMTELAENLGVSVPAASRMVDGLARRRLVRRSTSPADRRNVQLELTALGRKVYTQAREQAQKSLAELLGNLSDDETAQLLKGLDLLARVSAQAVDDQEKL